MNWKSLSEVIRGLVNVLDTGGLTLTAEPKPLTFAIA